MRVEGHKLRYKAVGSDEWVEVLVSEYGVRNDSLTTD